MSNTDKQDVPHFTEETKQALEELFKSKDVDQNGVLDPEELEECLFVIGINPTPEDLEFFIKNFDKNKDGKLQIQELIDNVHVLYAHSMYKEDLVTAFTTIDKDNNGYVRYTELYKILTFKKFMTPDEARKIVGTMADKFDSNKDGRFNYAEFVEMFLSKEYCDTVRAKQNEQEQSSNS